MSGTATGNIKRTYGRVKQPDGSLKWVEVTTDSTGSNDYVYITTLIQVLKLILGESPFHADYGIPSEQAVLQQIFPDYYVMQVQQQFSKYFSSLIISKVQSTTPTYNVNIVTNQGTKFSETIAG